MAVVVLCVAAWVVSCWKEMSVCHYGKIISGGLGFKQGRMWCQLSGKDPYIPNVGWQFYSFGSDPDAWSNAAKNAKFFAIGFAYYPSGTVTVPFWFLSVVFAAPLFFLWRKTRSRGGGKAFPVEVATPKVKA